VCLWGEGGGRVGCLGGAGGAICSGGGGVGHVFVRHTRHVASRRGDVLQHK